MLNIRIVSLYVSTALILSSMSFIVIAEPPVEDNIYIITFSGPIQNQWKEKLEEMGVKLFEYRQLYKYLAETPYYLKNDIQKF